MEDQALTYRGRCVGKGIAQVGRCGINHISDAVAATDSGMGPYSMLNFMVMKCRAEGHKDASYNGKGRCWRVDGPRTKPSRGCCVKRTKRAGYQRRGRSSCWRGACLVEVEIDP